MKLKDLKQGMICELRNGSTLTIFNNNVNEILYYSRDGDQIYFPLIDNYNDDLTHQRQKDYDIIKVTFKIQKQENNLFFEPKKDENYYYVNDGSIWTHENDETKYDDAILRTNIVFKTREEAEKELLKQQAKIRVIKEIARLNDGWDVKEHWENQYIEKYYIAYYHEASELTTNYNRGFKYMDNNLYLKTRELAEQLIETHSDDLKLMLEVER